jgi:uncharacterized protein YutE (UPF0331/DUF86 family)
MINGILYTKLQTIDEILLELRSLGQVTEEQLRQDWRIRKAIERNLQILTEIVIDVCQRMLALADQTPATTGVEAVQRCVELHALSSVEPYRKMVQFRNFIVHRYDHIDVNILVDIVNHRLKDFEAFRQEIREYAARELEKSTARMATPS